MRAIITGATRGIGHAIAMELAKNGWHLVLIARNEEDLIKTAEACVENGAIGVEYYRADLSESNDLNQVIADVFTEHVDILINNLGVFIPDTVHDFKMENMVQQINTNFFPAISLAKRFLEQKFNKRGKLIFISSISGKSPVSYAASYSMTKQMIHQWIQLLRRESFPVDITEIIPAQVATSSWEGTGVDTSTFIQPSEIAVTINNILKLTSCNIEEVIVKPKQ